MSLIKQKNLSNIFSVVPYIVLCGHAGRDKCNLTTDTDCKSHDLNFHFLFNTNMSKILSSPT